MILTTIIIICFLVVIFVFVILNYKKDVSYVKSRVDNKQYLVYNLRYQQLAADILAKVRLKLTNTCIKLQKKYPNDERIVRLVEKFNPDNIVESEPDSKNTSYSINKGEKIVLCLRSRDGQQRIVKENILMFVALHELAHIMTKSVGHTKEFWDNFEFLLREAIEFGYYVDIDYSSDPHMYCGVEITDSPLKR